jgi:transcriptional regulator with XRE-family HTH domain
MDATLLRLIEIAESKGIGQTELALKAGLPENRLSRLKESKKQTSPRFHEAAAMARVLGVSLDELAWGLPGDPDAARLREVIAEVGTQEAWRRIIRAEPRRIVQEPLESTSEDTP